MGDTAANMIESRLSGTPIDRVVSEALDIPMAEATVVDDLTKQFKSDVKSDPKMKKLAGTAGSDAKVMQQLIQLVADTYDVSDKVAEKVVKAVVGSGSED